MMTANSPESFGRDHPQAPYYAGRNWKSAMSAATELDEHRKMTIQEYQRVRVQIEDSINRIDLCHKVSHACISLSLGAFCRHDRIHEKA